jgi:hypothetical protein
MYLVREISMYLMYTMMYINKIPYVYIFGVIDI